MTVPKRFKVSVDKDWNVNISDKDGPVGTARQMIRSHQDEEGGFFPRPPADELPPETEAHYPLCVGDDPQPIFEAYNYIRDRRRIADYIVNYGRYLFDCLIGPKNWKAIVEASAEAKIIELALQWSALDGNLNRLNWEMMCRYGQALPDNHPAPQYGFLADVLPKPVAVTRLVSEGATKARELSVPARILFVVGTSIYDPDIRPGAEYMYLLSQLKGEGRTARWRILEQATLSKLQRTIKDFQPDIVHFICHGDAGENGRGYLKLRSEEDPKKSVNLYSEFLLPKLKVNGGLPPIVVLSACNTGVALGPNQVGTLASELIMGDVPVVVAMAGRVSDRACRIFTTRFGEAIVAGEPLVVATAQGRWASFAGGRQAYESADWAFPTLFMSAVTDADYTPVDSDQKELDARVKKVEYRVKGLIKPPPPIVFCGRHDFIFQYEQLMASELVDALAIYTEKPRPRLGRTRLLEELTARALREEHIPVLVSSRSDKWKPFFANAAHLGFEIYEAILRTRNVFGLKISGKTHLIDAILKVSPIDYPSLGDPELDFDQKVGAIKQRKEQGLSYFRTLNGISGTTVKTLLQRDLKELRDDVYDHDEIIKDNHGLVLLLLDDVHLYEQGLSPLIHEIIGQKGLKIVEDTPDGEEEVKKEGVRVILAFSGATRGDEHLKSLWERKIPGFNPQRLEPFKKDGEDLLAFKHTLLHPHEREKDYDQAPQMPGISDVPWTLKPSLNEDEVQSWEANFRMGLNGNPEYLGAHPMYFAAWVAEKGQALEEADDEEALSPYRENPP